MVNAFTDLLWTLKQTDADALGIAATTPKNVACGEPLYHGGTPFESLFVIRRGFFKSVVLIEDGREQVTGFHMPGDVLGMDGIDMGRHVVDAVALQDSVVGLLPSERLENPGLRSELYRVMSRELVRNQGVMMLLGTMRAEERLAAFLLTLSRRFIAGGFSPEQGIQLPMGRDDIGSYLGMSLETVSRWLSRFHEDGVIAVRKKELRILDMEALRAVIHREERGGYASRASCPPRDTDRARVSGLSRHIVVT